jgi:hypothetical protein
VVHVSGAFDAAEDPEVLVERLVAEAGADPLMVDLSGLHAAMSPAATAFVHALARAPIHRTIGLIHPDLETRRALRARSNGLPVVPSNDLVLNGHFASKLFSQQRPAEHA